MSPPWVAGQLPSAGLSRSQTDGGVWREAALVGVAVFILALPSVSHLEAATPAAASRIAVLAAQDTSGARRRQDLEARRRRARRAVRAQGDSVLADSLAPADPFPEPDSIMRALMQRSGYRPVLYRGDTLRLSTGDHSIHIQQRASIERAGEKLFADSVVYDGESRYVIAYGKSKLINAKGEEIDSEEGPLFYHTERHVGTVIEGRTQWEIWNVEGNFTLEGSDTLWVRSGIFTSCELPEPHYYFASDKIKLVLGHIVVAWPVRLYFGDVPVFWFPFMAQDIRQGRRSGILTPAFGINDVVRNSDNHRRHISNIGYYWAISDYMDAQIRFDWWSSTWTRIDGFYRYRWRDRLLDGRLGYSQFFLADGTREMSLVWNHSQKFGERSDLRASVRFVSSTEFEQQAEFNPERLTQRIRSDVGFTRRFDWGMLNLSAQRTQPLTEGKASTLNFPQASITLTPLVLTPARSPLEARWYNGLTWTGSFNYQHLAEDEPGQPDRSVTAGGATSGFALGNLRWNSNATIQEVTLAKPDTLFPADTSIIDGDTTVTGPVIIGPEVVNGTISWRTSLGYQQRLIGSTTLTPAVDLSGSFLRSNETNLDYISTPTRTAVSASLNSDIFGFFPGIGPATRIRHKFSPGIRWSYSPEVSPSARLNSLERFSTALIEERHQVSLGLTQTFEAKLRAREPESSAEGRAVEDSVGPRAPPQERKITVLAVRTSAVTYDFVQEELITDRLSNNITSDLLRGLAVRVTHDLFEQRTNGRKFKPFLSELNLSFSLGARSFAGIFGSSGDGIQQGRGILPETRGFEPDEELTSLDERAGGEEGERRRSRPWNLAIDYSLIRQRPLLGEPDPPAPRQTIRANLGFSPTENWTVSWRTTYDLEERDFVDQILRLRRDLHRWSATFDFSKASNDNFIFTFAVHLNDLPDVKFDYRQETVRSIQ